MCYKNEYQKRAHGEVERIFRELLPEAGLHVREEQIRLCHEMLDALMKNEITLCDAGVGIGKTYAYLTACILMRKYSVLHSGYSGCDRRPVVVSTSSIALQKAIIEEYVPFLSDVLLKADLLQEELKAVVRKGKEHFVCDYRLAQRLEAVRDKNKNQVQMEALKSLRHNFDLDSVHNLSGFDRRLVCVPKFCPRECPGKAGCRYQKYLDTSRKEDIFLQICNHNYLLADAMHRANGYRPLLADYRALVVDEAHKLPEAASQMYGRKSIAIPYGTYLVRETTTPHNYKPVDDFIVRITENKPTEPQTWRVLLDKEFSAKLKIIKQDDETKKSVLIPRTEFKIYDMDHEKYVEQVTTYPTTVTHTSYFTDTDGYLILPQNLKIGHYRIEEVTAPEGYTINKNYAEI